MIDNLVSNHLLPAYKQNRAHSRHYRSEYVRGYQHRQADEYCLPGKFSQSKYYIVFAIFILMKLLYCLLLLLFIIVANQQLFMCAVMHAIKL